MPQVGNAIQSKNVTTDLAAEPVTLAEVKEYGSIAYSDYDALLTALIKTARLQLERYTDKSFGEKTVQIDFTHSGVRSMRLPLGPIASIETLFHRRCLLYPYTDSVESGIQYELQNDRFIGPEGYYMATCKTSAQLVTEAVKTAIKAQSAYLFENREDAGKSAAICPTAKALLFNLIPGENLL